MHFIYFLLDEHRALTMSFFLLRKKKADTGYFQVDEIKKKKNNTVNLRIDINVEKCLIKVIFTQ